MPVLADGKSENRGATGARSVLVLSAVSKYSRTALFFLRLFPFFRHIVSGNPQILGTGTGSQDALHLHLLGIIQYMGSTYSTMAPKP